MQKAKWLSEEVLQIAVKKREVKSKEKKKDIPISTQSPLDYKEIQPVHSKGDQSWVFFGRTDAASQPAS